MTINKRTGRGAPVRFAILLSIAVSAWAQHTELAANGDGSVLYVVSYSVLRGATPARPETRIYRIAADGVQLFAQRENVPPDNPGPLDGVSDTQVSADGGVIAFTAFDVCVTTNPCVAGELAELRGPQSLDLGPGTVQMTRNGRWVLVSPPGGITAQSFDLIDLKTGQYTSIPIEVISPLRVASDGSLWGYRNGPGFGVLRNGQFSPIAVPSTAILLQPLAVSDNGRIFVYAEIDFTSGGLPAFRLVAMDTASSHATVLFDRLLQSAVYLGMSDDGRSVLFRVTDGSVQIADTSSGQNQVLSLPNGELPTAGALSGDGNFAFVATSNGRIARFNLTSQTFDTLIPPTPDAGRRNVFSPGSLYRLHGYIPGSADDLTGHILLNGQPVPVVYVDVSTVAIQAPWELPAGDVPFSLDVAGGGSPFIDSEVVKVSALAPAFELSSAGNGITLIKGDFSGPVTAWPNPGDIVTTYMTGLGPVQGNPQTGVPSPSDVLMPVTGATDCTLNPQKLIVPVLFAGLAPGTIGVYQVTLQWPAGAEQRALSTLQCQITTADVRASAIGLLPFSIQ